MPLPGINVEAGHMRCRREALGLVWPGVEIKESRESSASSVELTQGIALEKATCSQLLLASRLMDLGP